MAIKKSSRISVYSYISANSFKSKTSQVQLYELSTRVVCVHSVVHKPVVFNPCWSLACLIMVEENNSGHKHSLYNAQYNIRVQLSNILFWLFVLGIFPSKFMLVGMYVVGWLVD